MNYFLPIHNIVNTLSPECLVCDSSKLIGVISCLVFKLHGKLNYHAAKKYHSQGSILAFKFTLYTDNGHNFKVFKLCLKVMTISGNKINCVAYRLKLLSELSFCIVVLLLCDSQNIIRHIMIRKRLTDSKALNSDWQHLPYH